MTASPRSQRVVLAVVAVSAALLMMSVLSRHRPGLDPAEFLALRTVGVEGLLAALALVGALFSRQPLARRLGLGPGRLPGRHVALLVLGTLALSHAVDGALAWSGFRDQSALSGFSLALERASDRAIWIALLGLGIVPGIAEELLFRGLLQRGLLARVGPVAAIVGSSLVFGAVHIEPIHAVGAAVLGLYLGVIAYWSGSIRAALLCHVLNNLVAVGTAVAGRDLPAWDVYTPIPAAAFAAGCLWVVARSREPARGARSSISLP